MSSFKVITVAMVLASAPVSGLPAQGLDAMGSDRGPRVDLLSSWWFPEQRAELLYAWSQPDEGRRLLSTWWEPVETSPLLYAFSSLQAKGGFALTWSRPDENRDLLFTWSQRLPATIEEGEGSGSGEPSAR